jgi:hypothetical protein
MGKKRGLIVHQIFPIARNLPDDSRGGQDPASGAVAADRIRPLVWWRRRTGSGLWHGDGGQDPASGMVTADRIRLLAW